MAAAEMTGHKNTNASTNARAGLTHTRPAHTQPAHTQPGGDHFSDLLAASSTHAQAAHAQAQRFAQNAAKADSAKPQTQGGQASAATDHRKKAHAGKTGKVTAQSEDIRHTETRHTDKAPDHKAGTVENTALPASTRNGKATAPVDAKAAAEKDTGAKNANVKDADTKHADKKDAGKKADSRQTQNGNGAPPPVADTLQAANAAASQQAASQANTAADKPGNGHTACANANAPGTAAANISALTKMAGLATPARPGLHDTGKATPKSAGETQAATQNGKQNGTQSTTVDPAGNPAGNTPSGPAADMLAALNGKAGGPSTGHGKSNDAGRDANIGPAAVQDVQTPAGASSRQDTQSNTQTNESGNQVPAPAGGQGPQSIIPDPSALGAGSAGTGGHIATAAQGTIATNAGSSAGALASQTLQINQTPLPLPNMTALGIAITTRFLSGTRQFDIRLDPPALGRVDVRLSIDSTGKTQAHLSADHQQTLELLQKDSSGLARALRDAGLNVAQNGLNFSLRQHSGGGTNQGGFSSRGGGGRARALPAIASLAPSAAILAPGHLSQSLRGPGRLDISV